MWGIPHTRPEHRRQKPFRWRGFDDRTPGAWREPEAALCRSQRPVDCCERSAFSYSCKSAFFFAVRRSDKTADARESKSRTRRWSWTVLTLEGDLAPRRSQEGEMRAPVG